MNENQKLRSLAPQFEIVNSPGFLKYTQKIGIYPHLFIKDGDEGRQWTK